MNIINPSDERLWRYKFGKPKSARLPAAPAPSPVPKAVDEEVEQKARDKRRQRITAAGRAGTILTDTSQGVAQGAATLLGRSS